MGIFNKKRAALLTDEEKFDRMMEMIKDLPKEKFKKFKEALDSGYKAYQTIKQVKTNAEMELGKAYEEQKKNKLEYEEIKQKWEK